MNDHLNYIGIKKIQILCGCCIFANETTIFQRPNYNRRTYGQFCKAVKQLNQLRVYILPCMLKEDPMLYLKKKHCAKRRIMQSCMLILIVESRGKTCCMRYEDEISYSDKSVFFFEKFSLSNVHTSRLVFFRSINQLRII